MVALVVVEEEDGKLVVWVLLVEGGQVLVAYPLLVHQEAAVVSVCCERRTSAAPFRDPSLGRFAPSRRTGDLYNQESPSVCLRSADEGVAFPCLKA